MYALHSFAAGLLAFATLAAAAPRTLKMIPKRDCTGTFGDKATATLGDYTGCSSSHGDGDGIYVMSADDHHYASGVHCWTDVFYAGENFYWGDEKRSGIISDCTNAAEGVECTSTEEFSRETCYSISVGTEIGFEVGGKLLGFSASASVEWGMKHCTGNAISQGCMAPDGACVEVAFSEMRSKVDAYMRRRCDDGGDHTVWSHDFQIDNPVPNNNRVTCPSCTSG